VNYYRIACSGEHVYWRRHVYTVAGHGETAKKKAIERVTELNEEEPLTPLQTKCKPWHVETQVVSKWGPLS